MESAAPPCLDGLQRQVHMTFQSQAAVTWWIVWPLVEERNWAGNVKKRKRNSVEQYASVWLEGRCKRRVTVCTNTHTYMHTHRPDGALCWSEWASSAATVPAGLKAVEKDFSCATHTHTHTDAEARVYIATNTQTCKLKSISPVPITNW